MELVEARQVAFFAGRERHKEERAAEAAHRAGQVAVGVAAKDVVRYVPPDWDDPVTSRCRSSWTNASRGG